MEKHFTLENINPAAFDETLSKYSQVIPQKLHDLDQQRYEVIPASLAKPPKRPSLSKSEVSTLVDWKLSHGKFRPMLKSLLQQNSEKTIEDTTKEGFQAFSGDSDSAKASLAILTRLKGIGPATAALLLSVYDPQRAPFFSDELFRWCFYEPTKAKGWDREIKYNVKEYLQMFERVQELRTRFLEEFDRDLSAVDVEKVAYVLGKTSNASEATLDVKDPGEARKRKRAAGEEELKLSKKGSSSKASTRARRPSAKKTRSRKG